MRESTYVGQATGQDIIEIANIPRNAAPNESIAMEFKDFSTEQKDTKVKNRNKGHYILLINCPIFVVLQKGNNV